MAKATHYGICQACGAEQKLPNGTLSNHGYTVSWGFFEGVCPGSKKLPFELSCALVEQFINNAKRTIETFREEIVQYQENTSTKTMYLNIRRWHKAEVVDGKVLFLDKSVPASRLCLYGTDEQITKKLDEKRIKWLERQIKAVEEYIQWQEDRIANWEEKELTPIKEAK